MTITFNKQAASEFSQAGEWYEEQRAGLGEDFIAAIEASLKVIASDPERFQPVADPVRIYRLKKYPYNIFFRHFPGRQHIRILAIMHHRRRPDYWKERN